MKSIIAYSLIGVILFLLVYANIGIIKMPADDMKSSIQKNQIIIYRKFYLRPKYHDVLIYKSPFYVNNDSTSGKKYLFIQRIVALPGDTILIDSARVYVNHQLEQPLPTYQKNYIIQLNDSIERFPHIYTRIQERTLISKKYEYAVSISYDVYSKLLQDTNVLSISYEYENPSIYSDDIFPYHSALKWNKHFFGPLYLPKKNDTVPTRTQYLNIYLPLIQKEEPSAMVQNDSLFINGKYVSNYVFKHNYYFVMGDNRDNAIDSRYFGPIQEDDIIGILLIKF